MSNTAANEAKPIRSDGSLGTMSAIVQEAGERAQGWLVQQVAKQGRVIALDEQYSSKRGEAYQIGREFGDDERHRARGRRTGTGLVGPASGKAGPCDRLR